MYEISGAFALNMQHKYNCSYNNVGALHFHNKINTIMVDLLCEMYISS